MKSFSPLLACLCWLTAAQWSHADVQYVFGVENLVGRTSDNGTLESMTVRVGKFQTGFIPTRLNYDSWATNFVSMLPANETLVADGTSFLTPSSPDTGAWRMSNNSVTIEVGQEPTGFVAGDQIFIWISNSTVGSASTQAALLTDASWTYVTPTALPQPTVAFALQDEAPTLVVGGAFSDHYTDTASEVGIRLATRNIPVPSPELTMEGPGAQPLEDSVSTVTFGPIPNHSTTTQVLTIKNIGNADLTNITTSIDGTDAAFFSVSADPVWPVSGPSGSTTLTVRFSPTVAGVKNAVLHVSSNDAASPFDIALQGNALLSPGAIAINMPAGSIIPVSEDVAGGQVFIPIIRQGGSDGSVNFNITATGGTAAGLATVNTDFNLPTSPQTMGNGVATISVPITIHNPLNTNEPNETFTVTISGPTGGATLGTVTTVTVRIIDSVDTTLPPAPVMSSPLASALVGRPIGGTIGISGTASDNKGVAGVEVMLNNSGTYVPAVLTTPGAASSNWSLNTLIPKTGSNTISVRSIDTRGNVTNPPATRTFTILRPLVVNVNSSQGSVTAGFAGSTDREVGKSFNVVATAKAPTTTPASPGTLFTGWTANWASNTPTPPAVPSTPAESAARIGVPLVSLEKNSLTFIFREGLELTPNFVTNPYTTAVTGTYNGLIKPSSTLPVRPGVEPDGTVTSNSTEGYFTATVQNTGAFSGRLTIDGFVLNVAGSFDHQGRARFGTARSFTQTVARTGKPSLSVRLDIGGPDGSIAPAGKIIGEISATEFQRSVLTAVSEVDADRAHFTGLTADLTVPDPYLTVTGSAPSPTGRTDGSFTVVMPSIPEGSQPPRIIAAGYTAEDYPQGDGVGTLKISKAGAVTLTGTLPDGTGVTATGTLSQDLRVALFAPLYTAKGFFSAHLKLNSLDTESDLKTHAGTEVKWARPIIATSHYYPSGWPEVLSVGFMGAKFATVTNQSVMKAPDGADQDNLGDTLQAADADGNVRLTFSDGQLLESLVKAANLSVTDLVTKVPDNDPTFTLLVNRTTGAVTGTFTHTDDTIPSFNAILYQKGTGAGAYGYFLTRQPPVVDYRGESGGVTILGQP